MAALSALLVALFLLGSVLTGQAQILTQPSPGVNPLTPIKFGTLAQMPTSCLANRQYYNVTNPATPGQQLYVCNGAGNGFVLVGDGGGGVSAIADKKVLGNMAGASAVPIAITPGVLVSANYSWSQQPGGSLSVGSNTVTLTPCPAGVSGTNTNHPVYLSGGTGSAEAVTLTGGTCTSGATTGTVTFTAANTHSGAWTIATATSGIIEAFYAGGNPTIVYVPAGSWTVYAKIVPPYDGALVGAGINISQLVWVSGFVTRGLEIKTPNHAFSMADLTLYYLSNGTSGEAIYLEEQVYGILENIQVFNSYKGLTAYSVGGMELKSLLFNPRNDCMTFSSNSASSVITVTVPTITGGRCTMNGATGNVLTFGPTIAGMTITGFVSALGANAIAVSHSSGAVNEVTLTNNIFDSLATAMVNIQPTGTGGMTRWNFTSNMFSGTSAATQGVIISTPTAGNIGNVTFANNTISMNHASAIGMNLQGINGMTITNNIISDAVASSSIALYLNTKPLTNVSITGNIIGVGSTYSDSNPFTYGISLDSQAHTGIVIAGNHLKGSTANISNSSTGAVSIIAQEGTTTAIDGPTLTVDGTNHRVGIGTTAPDVKLTVSANTSALPAPPFTSLMRMASADANGVRALFDGFGGPNSFDYRRSNGTAASPTALAADDLIGQFVWFGYGSTGYSTTARAVVRGSAGQAWTDTNQGTYVNILTTPNNSTTIAEQFRVNSTGIVITGTLTATAIASNTGAQSGYLCYNTTAPGTITYDGTNTCLVSLEEYKDILEKIDNGLDIVQKLRPFWGKFKDGTPMTDKAVQPFFGAHQVESVDPRLVTYTEDGKLHGVRYDHLTAVIVSALQEQQTQINALRQHAARQAHAGRATQAAGLRGLVLAGMLGSLMGFIIYQRHRRTIGPPNTPPLWRRTE